MNQASEYSHMQRTNLNLLPRSWAFHEGVEYALVDTGAVIKLAVLCQLHPPVVSGFVGDASEFEGQTLQVCPLTPENAAVLRSKLPWLRPKLLGTQTSAGMGDRLGLATPGHVKAVQRTDGNIAPIFAQQSIREMTRTGRSPVQVMDDAMWGVFQEGWRSGFGADADHLKTIQDIDSC
ncbi:MAG: tagaturonate epimerase family protein, partial [Bellilinea sp.]